LSLLESDRQSNDNKKAGGQFRQSQQAYEPGVQGSETFEGDAEVCHSGSEGVSVRHMTEDKESLWESRSGEEIYFRDWRGVLTLYPRKISFAWKISISTEVRTRSGSCVSMRIGSGEIITIIAESKSQVTLQTRCPATVAMRKTGLSES